VYKLFLLLLGLLAAFIARAEWRDPTTPGNLPAAPLLATPGSAAALTLSAILITDNGKRAIVNGVTLKAGEYLDDDTQLLKILPGHVVIRQHDTVKKLTLVPSVKKPLK